MLGTVVDGAGVREQWERGHARGLRSTGGVTADGRLVVATFFESAATQDLRKALAPSLDGPPTVFETEDVHEVLITDPTGARFLQGMRASVTDRARFEAVEDEIGAAFVQHRPDFLAGYRMWLPDGTLMALDYFSSEAEARAGEAKPLPNGLAAGFGQWQSLVDVENADWYDLTDPWISSSR